MLNGVPRAPHARDLVARAVRGPRVADAVPVVAVRVLRTRARSTPQRLILSSLAHGRQHRGKQLNDNLLMEGQHTISSTMGPFFSEKSLAKAVAFFTASTSMPSTLHDTCIRVLQKRSSADDVLVCITRQNTYLKPQTRYHVTLEPVPLRLQASHASYALT